jgi:hypothetical protein
MLLLNDARPTVLMVSNVCKEPFFTLKSPVISNLVLSVPDSIPNRSISKLLLLRLAL